ncbi:MAG: helix-turn-helix transcriptional regulator [Methylobacterium frigidaeris]
MADWSNVEVIGTLKEVMAKRSVKLTDLSKLTDIPYRSLQNYFSGKTQMPVTVYLRVCAVLGLDPMYAKNESFKLEYYSLRRALIRALGELLPTRWNDGHLSPGLEAHRGEPRSEFDLWRDSGNVADLIRMYYDQDLETQLYQSLVDDDDVGSPIGSPINDGEQSGSSKK